MKRKMSNDATNVQGCRKLKIQLLSKVCHNFSNVLPHSRVSNRNQSNQFKYVKLWFTVRDAHRFMTLNEPKRQKLGTAEFPAVGEAWKTIFWPSQGFKDRILNSSNSQPCVRDNPPQGIFSERGSMISTTLCNQQQLYEGTQHQFWLLFEISNSLFSCARTVRWFFFFFGGGGERE